MDSLFQRIRRRLGGRETSGPHPRLLVAAFGKHPGWDDHMEDIGLETPALVALKRVLYVEGIGKNIDSGKWADLEARQSAIEFGHTFVWCRDSDTLAGRLWPSRDGRGRTSYPMVVCTQGRQVSLRWMYECVLPYMTHLEMQCRNSSTADEVRAYLLACKGTLQTTLDAVGGPARELHDETDHIATLLQHPGSGLSQEGLIRILYHLHRETSASVVSRAGRNRCEHSAHARVPASRGLVAEASILWTRLLLREYGPHTSVLVFMPHQRAWLDIIIGEPSAPQFVCLRASPEALPLTNTVPYKITDEFVERIVQKTGISKVSDDK
jgi:hypothetical protein